MSSRVHLDGFGPACQGDRLARTAHPGRARGRPGACWCEVRPSRIHVPHVEA
jgi:hypothetical protein